MANTMELKEKIVSKSEPTKSQPTKMDTFRALLDRMKPELVKALPKHLDVDRILRIMNTEARRNPKLLEASQTSLLGALMLSAELGLEPGPLGHCWLIPYYNKKTNMIEVQFQIGYKGYLELIRRSGQLEMIDAEVVYQNDEFEFEYGMQPKLRHKPALSNRGAPIAVYAIAKLRDGGYAFYVMSVDDVNKIRARSKSPNEGPWVTDWDQMARKTAIRQLAKYLPLSTEVQRAVSVDETTKRAEPDLKDDEIFYQPDETDWQLIEPIESEQKKEEKEQQTGEIPNPFVRE